MTPRITPPPGRPFEPLLGFEERLTADQVDYLEAVSSFIEAYDRVRVKWPKGTPLDTLKFLLEQHEMSAADLARVLGGDRSMGPKLLRGERRLTVDHIRMLARQVSTSSREFCCDRRRKSGGAARPARHRLLKSAPGQKNRRE